MSGFVWGLIVGLLGSAIVGVWAYRRVVALQRRARAAVWMKMGSGA